MNGGSGIVNTHSGEWQKVFTFEQNRCSRCSRISVHVRLERVFTLIQNMQVLQFDETLRIYLAQLGINGHHVSISDERDFIVAFVVLESV